MDIKIDKENKIIYLPGLYDFTNTVGCYNFKTDIIYLDPSILNYPSLHKKVLEHEKSHRRFGKNLFKHLCLDIKDGVKLSFSRELQDIIYFHESKTWKEFIFSSLVWCVNIIVGTINTIINVPITIIYSIRRRFSTKQEQEARQ